MNAARAHPATASDHPQTADPEAPTMHLADLPSRRRLQVTARRPIDSEPPYERADPAHDTSPPVIGSLALALRAAEPAPETEPVRRPLELVPARTAAVSERRTEEFFDVVRTGRAELPAPGPRAGALVTAITETLSGRRPLPQLVRWLTTDVYEELEVNISPDRGRGWGGRLRRLIVSEPADGVAEVTAVVQRGPRATAMALRMEGRDGRWVVTALQLA